MSANKEERVEKKCEERRSASREEKKCEKRRSASRGSAIEKRE